MPVAAWSTGETPTPPLGFPDRGMPGAGFLVEDRF